MKINFHILWLSFPFIMAGLAFFKVIYEVITFQIPSETSMFVYTFGGISLIILGYTFVDAERQNNK